MSADGGGAWRSATRVAILVVALMTFLVLYVVRVPPVREEVAAGSFLTLAGSGDLAEEQSELMDPSALLLPGERNFGQGLTEAVRPVARREVYGAFEGGVVLGIRELPGQVGMAGRESASLERLVAAGNGFEMVALGRTPPAERGEVRVELVLRRMDGIGRREVRVVEAPMVAFSGGRPTRWVIRWERGSALGRPLLVESSDDPATDAESRRIVQGALLGLHPLESGLWEASVVW